MALGWALIQYDCVLLKMENLDKEKEACTQREHHVTMEDWSDASKSQGTLEIARKSPEGRRSKE